MPPIEEIAPQSDRTKALRDTVAEATESLLAEMQDGKSERFLAYLSFNALFHRYSPGNQMLIAWQCPAATRVASYKTWEKLGYHVAKGQKAIKILAPRPYGTMTITDEESGHKQASYQGISFVTTSVFDASQLNPTEQEARPLPEFFMPLGSDHMALAERLVVAMGEDGIVVSEGHTREAQGYSAGGIVVTKRGLASTNKALTLIHEWAHEVLHQRRDDTGRGIPEQIRECHAEATSYIVSLHFGLHNPFSADYLLNWGNTPKALLAELEYVSRAASYIITRLEGRGDGALGQQGQRILFFRCGQA